MSYERSMGMGYESMPGSCASGSISGGGMVCFRPTESSIAASRGCRSLGNTCRIGGSSRPADQGYVYCCPPRSGGGAPAPTPDPADPSGGMVDIGGGKTAGGAAADIWSGITDIFGGSSNVSSGGAGAPAGDAGGFLQQKFQQVTGGAADVARTVEEAITGAVDEVLPSSEGETTGLNWFERNRGVIMFGGTALSLGFGALWLWKTYGKKSKRAS